MQDCKIKIIKLKFYIRKNGEMNMLTRKTKKVLAIVLTGAVALPGMASGTLVSAKAKCTTKKMTLQAGEKKTIKIKGKVKKAKYMFKSSKPSIAKVNKKGTVTAKKAGKAVITITEKKKAKIKDIFILQLVIAIYTLSTVFAKFASGQEFLSFEFILFYGIEMVILGLYAIIWQQLIKKFDISVAYANKAMGLLWSILIFNDTITIKNIIGVIIVIVGTIIVNSEDE